MKVADNKKRYNNVYFLAKDYTMKDDYNTLSRRELNRLKDIKQRSITRSTDKITKVVNL